MIIVADREAVRLRRQIGPFPPGTPGLKLATGSRVDPGHDPLRVPVEIGGLILPLGPGDWEPAVGLIQLQLDLR